MRKVLTERCVQLERPTWTECLLVGKPSYIYYRQVGSDPWERTMGRGSHSPIPSCPYSPPVSSPRPLFHTNTRTPGTSVSRPPAHVLAV